MKKIYYMFAVLCCTLGVLTGRSQAATTIVNDGKSTFTIVLPDKAPRSVQDAAAELQKDINLATGANLPIKKDNEKINEPIISLGSTKQAITAGITAKDIKVEGFRILTKNGNLYIIGPDTAANIGNIDSNSWGWRSDLVDYKLRPDLPGNQLTDKAGFSNGTANGVYTFLEDYLGVRWLMPGDIGRDVPKKSTFVVPDLDRREAPTFASRKLAYLYPTRQPTDSIEKWSLHQKLGFSMRVTTTHYWRVVVRENQFERHPEWFAMINGKRQDPTTVRYKGSYKLERTNKQLIRYYANRAIAALKANPYEGTFSLSPTDGRGYSQSPESKKWYDPSVDGVHPSVTPLILKFYRDVAAIVEKEYPQGMLAGFIYQDFKYPPKKGSAKLPKNFIPMLVGTGTGYSYYRKEQREQQSAWTKEWAERGDSDNWFYFGIPNNVRHTSGTITPAAPDILNYVFKMLTDNKFKGVYLYGDYSWSQKAMSNYIQAKMLWNSSLDANQLQHEWLMRAYGEKAGAVIESLYNEMDNGSFANYMRENPGGYGVPEKTFKDYYAPHYKEIESTIVTAQNQPMTQVQKSRLQLLADNVIVLQWRLKNAGYIPANYQSSLTRSSPQVAELLESWEANDFALFPTTIYPEGRNRVHSSITPTTVTLSEELSATKKETALPNPQRLLFYATHDGYVRLKFSNVEAGSAFVSYQIAESSTGRIVQSGIVYDGINIPVLVRNKQSYYLIVEANGVTRPKVKWNLTIADATLTTAFVNPDGAVQMKGSPEKTKEKNAFTYVYVPSNYPQEVREIGSNVELLTPLTEAEKMQEKYPNAKTMQNLDEGWKFQPDPKKDGEKQGFISVDFDDGSWKEVHTNKQWQFQGFADFHGTGWYRKTFTAKKLLEDDDPGKVIEMLLHFGAVDGDAIIYLNGEKVGEHLLGEKDKGWNEPFFINITDALINGKNTLVVKVTKDATDVAGGIFGGVELQISERDSK